MAKDVVVGLWHLDTRADPGDAEPTWQMKADALRQQLVRVQTGFAAALAGVADPTQAIRIFVVPEYYFAMGGDYIRAYTEAEKNLIVGRLRDISGAYPNVILVPGTLNWKVRLTRPERQALADEIQQSVGGIPGHHKLRQPMGDAHGEVKLKGVDMKGKLRTAFQWLPGVTHTPKTRWYGYNVAFAFYGGELIGQVKKAAEYHEFGGEHPNDHVIMIPGTDAGTFDVPGVTGIGTRLLKVGLEICRDSSIGRLAAFEHPMLDFHVVVSASTRTALAQCREGGLYIHCDSHHAPKVGEVDASLNRTWVPEVWSDAGNDLTVMRATLRDRS